MANYTQKYNLILPEGPDYYRVDDANNNAIKIDGSLSSLNESILNIQSEITNEINTKLDQIIGEGDGKIQSLQEIIQYINENGEAIEEINTAINSKVSNETFDAYRNQMASYHTSIDNSVKTLQTDITNEVSNRQTADTAIDSKIGNIAALTTTAKDNVVNAVNEIDSEVGPLNILKTTATSSVVNAINSIVDELGISSGDNENFQDSINKSISELKNQFRNILLLDKEDGTGSYVSFSKTDKFQFNISLSGVLMLYKGVYTSINLPVILSATNMTEGERTLYVGMKSTEPNPLDLTLSFNESDLTDPQAILLFDVSFPVIGTSAEAAIDSVNWVDDETLPYFGNSSNITYWLGVYNMIKNKLTLGELGLGDEINIINENISDLDDELVYRIKEVDSKFDTDIGSITVSNTSTLALSKSGDGLSDSVAGTATLSVTNGSVTRQLTTSVNKTYNGSWSTNLFLVATINPYSEMITNMYLSDELPYPSHSDTDKYLSYYDFKRIFFKDDNTTETFDIPIAIFDKSSSVTYCYGSNKTINCDSVISDLLNSTTNNATVTIGNNLDPLCVTKCTFKQLLGATVVNNLDVTLDLSKMIINTRTKDLTITSDNTEFQVTVKSSLSTEYGYVWLKPTKDYECELKYTTNSSDRFHNEGYTNVGTIIVQQDDEDNNYYFTLSYTNDIPQNITMTVNDLLSNIAAYLESQVFDMDQITVTSINSENITSTSINTNSITFSEGEINETLTTTDVSMIHNLDATLISSDNVVFGRYIGDGQRVRIINLGFEPAALLIMTQTGKLYYEDFYDLDTGEESVPACKGGLAFKDYSALCGNANNNFSITTATDDGVPGFRVYAKEKEVTDVFTTYYGSNVANEPYHFIAWKRGTFIDMSNTEEGA